MVGAVKKYHGSNRRMRTRGVLVLIGFDYVRTISMFSLTSLCSPLSANSGYNTQMINRNKEQVNDEVILGDKRFIALYGNATRRAA